jgi:ubiquinone/menaquinone biosynthesis C-methylase UbiE
MEPQTAVELGDLPRIDVIETAVGPLKGLRVIDIGCGEGQVARSIAARGAVVQGYDPFIAPTEWTPEGDGVYRLAKMKTAVIPEPDASADLVIFIFSLHHVPKAMLAATLAEARRVLKPGGKLFVAEPLAEGPGQYVMELYHDETEVRRDALAALETHVAPAFSSQRLLYFVEPRSFSDFDAYAAQAISNMRFNGYTEAEVLNPEVRRRFDEMHSAHGGQFSQRVRINLFG